MTESEGFAPKILVFSTNNISDPGIDLAGSSHLHYSPTVVVISLPCTSGIKPSWIVYAIERGFDGVFIAADGEECAFLPDCSERTAKIMVDAQALLQEKGHDAKRVKMAAVCSVCADPFVNYMREFSSLLFGLGPSRPSGQPAGSGKRPSASAEADGGRGGMKYDVLVVGSGIGGMESALKLGDMGYKVLLVEKEGSVGGRMILLSKVFPTLDCASCISTPKMGATIHHANVTVLTYSEVDGIREDGSGWFRGQHPPEAALRGHGRLHRLPPVRDGLQRGRAGRVQRRHGLAAGGLHRLPAGRAQEGRHRAGGHFALRAGLSGGDQASRLRRPHPQRSSTKRPSNWSARPLRWWVASGGPATPPARRSAPGASWKDRSPSEGSNASSPTPTTPRATPRWRWRLPTARRWRVIGSGPAGLTAAWHLARKGYSVTIFEAASQPGGMLRLALPPFRLPNEVVDDDVANVTDAGVKIVTDARVDDLEALKAEGYDAVLLAIGTHQATKLRVPGEDLRGVMRAADFLKAAKLGEELDVKDRQMVVIGGGNVAIDVARTALRHGAKSAQVVSLESHEEMPAHPQEVKDAAAEGVVFRNSCGVARFTGEERVQGVDLMRCVAVFDDKGRFSPRYADGNSGSLICDVVVVAAGMRPDSGEFGLPINSNGTIQVDEVTLQTSVPYVFAAGDVVLGPSMITSAAGQGRRAAFMMDRWLQGEPFDAAEFDGGPATVDKNAVLARQAEYSRLEPLTPRDSGRLTPGEFYADEETMTEEEALASAARCLDCGVCSECQECVKVCPPSCIHLDMQGSQTEAEVGAVISGDGLHPIPGRPQAAVWLWQVQERDHGHADGSPAGPHPALQRGGPAGRRQGARQHRLHPVHGLARRDPGQPSLLAHLLHVLHQAEPVDHGGSAAGRRDRLLHGHPRGRQGLRRVLRAGQGDGDQLREGPGGRGDREGERQPRPALRGHRERDLERGRARPGGAGGGGAAQRRRPAACSPKATWLWTTTPTWASREEDLDPAATNLPGVYVAGSASGVKDIPDSILHAGAAVAGAAAYLERTKVKA